MEEGDEGCGWQRIIFISGSWLSSVALALMKGEWGEQKDATGESQAGIRARNDDLSLAGKPLFTPGFHPLLAQLPRRLSGEPPQNRHSNLKATHRHDCWTPGNLSQARQARHRKPRHAYLVRNVCVGIMITLRQAVFRKCSKLGYSAKVPNAARPRMFFQAARSCSIRAKRESSELDHAHGRACPGNLGWIAKIGRDEDGCPAVGDASRPALRWTCCGKAIRNWCSCTTLKKS